MPPRRAFAQRILARLDRHRYPTHRGFMWTAAAAQAYNAYREGYEWKFSGLRQRDGYFPRRSTTLLSGVRICTMAPCQPCAILEAPRSGPPPLCVAAMWLMAKRRLVRLARNAIQSTSAARRLLLRKSTSLIAHHADSLRPRRCPPAAENETYSPICLRLRLRRTAGVFTFIPRARDIITFENRRRLVGHRTHSPPCNADHAVAQAAACSEP